MEKGKVYATCTLLVRKIPENNSNRNRLLKKLQKLRNTEKHPTQKNVTENTSENYLQLKVQKCGKEKNTKRKEKQQRGFSHFNLRMVVSQYE
jgi:hypothetical protein